MRDDDHDKSGPFPVTPCPGMGEELGVSKAGALLADWAAAGIVIGVE